MRISKLPFLVFFVVFILFISACTRDNIEKGAGEENNGLAESNDISEPREQEEGCKADIKFDYPPVNLEKTKVMIPLGLMIDSHVTPIDHHYFQDFDNEEADIEVYSPGDGYVTSIQHMPGAPAGKDYRVVIEHTCTVSSIYIHIDILSEKLKENAPAANSYVSVRVPVEAGEIIGYYSKNVDYNLVDTEVVLPGFVVKEHYNGEPWKIHVPPNTFDYFNEPVKSRLIEKNLRTAEPISGKIDYDIDGRLVGNWFLEGTKGYAGGPGRYWLGHLAFAYDYLDPDRIVLSIGNYDGENSRQYAVKGNTPDPADLSAETGVVEYELVQYDYFTADGDYWDRKFLAKGIYTEGYDQVEGVVLVQMTEERKIRFEAFPGKDASEVTGFTENAKMYER
ncbi:hypothetical protein QT06_C0001G0487 [archaeon GW2011_AR15]|nr:hypothetical protein QT06_C0001G0487 [archaeon GW2011_AR15]MBS3103798.1 hypothetical protein [Candidatus Woesearchaeota archaeon]